MAQHCPPVLLKADWRVAEASLKYQFKPLT